MEQSRSRLQKYIYVKSLTISKERSTDSGSTWVLTSRPRARWYFFLGCIVARYRTSESN